MGKWKIYLDPKSKVPLYRQIIETVINDIEKAYLKKGDVLPSINEFSAEFEVARDTVEKAYRHLKEQGIVVSVKGKGYFIGEIKSNQLRILLVLNKLSAYKKIIYYSFIKTLGDNAIIDLQIHHYNVVLFKRIIDDNLGKYHFYVIMPHFYEELDRVDITRELRRIPSESLVFLDKKPPDIISNFASVYQDFENDIYDCLESIVDLIRKYAVIKLIFPLDGYYPIEIVQGFKKFCRLNEFRFEIIESLDQITIETGVLFVIIEENDLVDLAKIAINNQFKLGSDIGVISFNETTLKEVLLGGITTISTDFVAMGKVTAELILQNHSEKIRNPFSIFLRSSL